MASVICTLPKELDADNPDHVRQWSEATVKWLQEHMPGEVQLVQLHMDETTPHVHALIRPIDERGHMSYRAHYHGRLLLKNLQASYAAALAPMGVSSNTREVKEELSKSYTKGIHGWRARKELTALQQERAELREALKSQQITSENQQARESQIVSRATETLSEVHTVMAKTAADLGVPATPVSPSAPPKTWIAALKSLAAQVQTGVRKLALQLKSLTRENKQLQHVHHELSKAQETASKQAEKIADLTQKNETLQEVRKRLESAYRSVVHRAPETGTLQQENQQLKSELQRSQETASKQAEKIASLRQEIRRLQRARSHTRSLGRER